MYDRELGCALSCAFTLWMGIEALSLIPLRDDLSARALGGRLAALSPRNFVSKSDTGEPKTTSIETTHCIDCIDCIE